MIGSRHLLALLLALPLAASGADRATAPAVPDGPPAAGDDTGRPEAPADDTEDDPETSGDTAPGDSNAKGMLVEPAPHESEDEMTRTPPDHPGEDDMVTVPAPAEPQPTRPAPLPRAQHTGGPR